MTQFTLLATLRDESPYIIDWIAHHRAIGITDFVLYQNDSSDGTTQLLQALHDAGEIHFIDNTNPADAPQKFRDLPPQRRAYARALRHEIVQNSDYILVIDADEYLDLPLDQDLPTFLTRLNHPDVISMPWRMMGSSNQTEFTPPPVTTRFTMAASPLDMGTERPFKQVKSLYRPKITRLYNLHKPRAFRAEVTWLDPDGTPIRPLMKNSNQLPDFQYKTANLRHYHVKSYPEFCVKIVRGFACTPTEKRSQLGSKMFTEMDANSVSLPLPEPLATRSAEIAAQIRQNPKIADIESHAIASFTKLTHLCQAAVDSHEILPTITRRYRLSGSLQTYFNDTVWSKMRTSP